MNPKTNILLIPGEVLASELLARQISQVTFAKSLRMPASNINELIKGKRKISVNTALKLEKELGIDADYWLRLQIAYDLFMARKKVKLPKKL